VAWSKEFHGRELQYTLGPNVSPDFARTLRRMYRDGLLVRATSGNQDARNYGQKMYYVAYTFGEKSFSTYCSALAKEGHVAKEP
jgi:hypothetical protein